MSRTTGVLGARCEGSGPVLALAQRKATPAPGRITAAHLMSAPSHVGLPSLEGVTTEHRFLADDTVAIGLAEILVTSEIAAAEDWEKSGRDPTKYLLLTLQRWIQDHGGTAIDRRFDLDVTISDRLVDYADERAPAGTLYLIVDPEAAAFVLLNPAFDILEKVHP